MKKTIIIGNGISGITAARNLRKRSDQEIMVVSAETDHFFSRTALMYIYMGHMKYENTKPYEDWFWTKNNINLVKDFVSSVDTDERTLQLKSGKTLTYDQLLIASGSKSNKFGWPGQNLPGVQGLYNYQDLELLEKNTHPYDAKASERRVHRAVIVGGGLIGVELAEMLMTRGIAVTFLIREDRFWGNVLPVEEGHLISRHLKEHGVELKFSTELKEIVAGPDGRAASIITNHGDEIQCQFVGLTAGVSPNIDFLKDSKIETQRGVKVNRFLETNVPNVYAAGDCAEFLEAVPGRRPIEQVWYTGRMMGETVAKTLSGNRTMYNPGHWFNSAKFFDIEYQTYGWVLGELREDEKSFYWESKCGKKCLKIVYDQNDYRFLGLNIFGIRLRHELVDKWLNEKRDVFYVLENIRTANFDPEFYKLSEPKIINRAEKHFGKPLSVKGKNLKSIFG